MNSHILLPLAFASLLAATAANALRADDDGTTWESHRRITDKAGLHHAAIREIRPGRLLYVHDGPKMSAGYVDVEKVTP